MTDKPDLNRFYTCISHMPPSMFQPALGQISGGRVYAPRSTIEQITKLARELGDCRHALAKLDRKRWPYSLEPVEWPCDKADWILLTYNYRETLE